CRAWLQANATPKTHTQRAYGQGLTADQLQQAARQWQGRKAEAGLGAITWPEAFGGRGGTAIQEMIYREEEGNFEVPPNVFAVSLGMVIPSLFVHASEAVRARHVAPALQGKELWCQLLSEPGAGSDLGMVRMRAERCQDGREGWILNGQKVWTTFAQFAEFGMVLTRSNVEVPKYEGMTSFFVDMKSPGIEVRPIRQANGDAEFNEVFFNDVYVPDSQRVGAEGAGWKVTLTALMNERLSIGGVMPPGLWRTAAQLMSSTTLNGASALADGRMRERLGNLYMNAHGLWLLQARGLTALGKGREPGPELSISKIVGARTLQDYGYLASDLLGSQGLLSAEELGDDARQAQMLWLG
ncbi:MAG: acyl-CoA dehydrogenase family protein, partial [Pseudomonas sp.]